MSWSWSTNTLYAVFSAALAFSPTVLAASRNIERDMAMQLSLQQAPIGVEPVNPYQYQLDPNWNIYAPRQTREFFWSIDEVVGAPDGYRREMLAVNGQFPGPLIEANTGDTVIVHVYNNLSIGTGIHWHGLDQVGSVYMDGLTGINQCPIAPGTTFTYNYTISDQFGTYWWHSHYAVQYTDGLQGPLIVHSTDDPLPKVLNYASDQIVMVDDWWHDWASYIADRILNNLTYGYDGHGPVAPTPDTTLINGVGRYNCPIGDACSPVGIPEIHVAAGKTHRLRLINTGSHAQQFISVDEHPLRVIEADDTPVDGPVLHRVPIHDGQRYSVLLDVTKDKPGDTFWLRTYVNAPCMPYFNDDMVGNMSAIVRITNEDGSIPNEDTPTSKDWTDTYATVVCVDIPLEQLVPLRLAPFVPQVAQEHAIFTYVLSKTLNRFVANNVTYTNHPYDAVLYSIFRNETLDPEMLTSFNFETTEGIDLIVNNADGLATDIGIDHPIHLHGRSFWIVAAGNGTITEADVPHLKYNTINPLRRDVMVIPRGSYAVLRIVTDDPGVWGMHCHIAWHLAAGFLGAIVVQPDEIRRLTPPDAWFQNCEAGNQTTTIPGLLPAPTSTPGALHQHHELKYWRDQ